MSVAYPLYESTADIHLTQRWAGIVRPYRAEEVERLRGSVRVEHTLAQRGAPMAIAPHGRLRSRARCADGQSSDATSARGAEGDLPERLAGRRGREPFGRNVPGPEPLPGQQRPASRATHQPSAPPRGSDR